MKKEIDVKKYGSQILESLSLGALLTTKAGDSTNCMTISWGTLGTIWARDIFITVVRTGRHTRKLLDKNGEFTINLAYGDYDKKILGFAGTKSGRDVNKIDQLGLTLVESDCISVPAIKELPLTLECKVVYVQEHTADSMPPLFLEKFYPSDVDSSFCGSNKDLHIAYYGEIVKAYIIED